MLQEGRSIDNDNLAGNELVTLQLLKVNEQNDTATDIQLLKEIIDENNFEDCMKSSKPISSIPAGLIDQMFTLPGHQKVLLPIVS